MLVYPCMISLRIVESLFGLSFVTPSVVAEVSDRDTCSLSQCAYPRDRGRYNLVSEQVGP